MRTPDIDAHGWLDSAIRLESPHHNERPCAVDTLVIHNISLPPGEYGTTYIDALFLGTLPTCAHEHPYFAGIAELRVSAHFYIARDGHIRQYVPIHRRAWHAGISHYRGRDNCNDFSIGIELEGCDEQSFEDAQYTRLANLIAHLRAQYPIEAVVGHADIAPGRKTDPGPCFDWLRLAAAA